MCVGGRATINALSRFEGSYALDDKELDIFILQFDSQNLGSLLVPHILPWQESCLQIQIVLDGFPEYGWIGKGISAPHCWPAYECVCVCVCVCV